MLNLKAAMAALSPRFNQTTPMVCFNTTTLKKNTLYCFMRCPADSCLLVSTWVYMVYMCRRRASKSAGRQKQRQLAPRAWRFYLAPLPCGLLSYATNAICRAATASASAKLVVVARLVVAALDTAGSATASASARHQGSCHSCTSVAQR